VRVRAYAYVMTGVGLWRRAGARLWLAGLAKREPQPLLTSSCSRHTKGSMRPAATGTMAVGTAVTLRELRGGEEV